MLFELAPEEISAPMQAAFEEALAKADIVRLIKDAVQSRLALSGLLTKEQVVAWLGIESVRSIDTYIKKPAEGGLGMPHMKIGHLVRFKLASLEEWAARFEVK